MKAMILSKIGTEKMQNNILVIDDNPLLIGIYERILKPHPTPIRRLDSFSKVTVPEPPPQRGFKLILASQGEQSLELAKEFYKTGSSIQIAFVDFNMPPGWDGLQTAKELLLLDEKINIVIVSGLPQHNDIEFSTKLQRHVHVISKPFPIKVLVELAHKLCETWNQDNPSKI